MTKYTCQNLAVKCGSPKTAQRGCELVAGGWLPVAGGVLVIGLGLLVAVFNVSGETLRVVSWNLEPKTVASATNNETVAIGTAAEALKKLAPDVILLQGVKDWQMCSEFAEALKPAEYNVAICSSFGHAAAGGANALEVGIVARHKAYFSWSEPWRSPEGVKVPGGYAFAALKVGERRVGVLTSEIGEPQMPALTAQQILDQIEAVKHWETNQAQTFVLGCTLQSISKSAESGQQKLFHFLGTAGLEDAFADVPLARSSTIERRAGQAREIADSILVDTGGFSGHAAVLSISVSEHYPVSCEVELDPARVATARAARQELARGAALPEVTETITNVQPQSASSRPIFEWSIPKPARWAGAAVAGLALIVVCSLLLRRRRSGVAPLTPAILPESVRTGGRKAAASYTVVIAPGSVTRSIVDAKAATQPQPVLQIEAPGMTQTQSASWQQRALAAEEQARRAQELLRQGLVSQLSQWLKQKLVRKLIVDRAQLLEAQEEAARKALKVDQRLNRIEQQIRQQNQAYERRIEELNRQLLAAKEESRELIRARIVQVKTEMEAARARLLAKAQEES